MLVARALDQRRLVFVDEMGTTTSLAPLYAWAPKGERARWEVPRNRGKNTTLVASMTTEGMGSWLAVVGSTTKKAVFAKPTSSGSWRLPSGPGRRRWWSWITSPRTKARRYAS